MTPEPKQDEPGEHEPVEEPGAGEPSEHEPEPEAAAMTLGGGQNILTVAPRPRPSRFFGTQTCFLTELASVGERSRGRNGVRRVLAAADSGKLPMLGQHLPFALAASPAFRGRRIANASA